MKVNSNWIFKMSRVFIEQEYDGVSIIVEDEEGTFKIHIDQEETHEKLLEVFERLGIEAAYENVY